MENTHYWKTFWRSDWEVFYSTSIFCIISPIFGIRNSNIWSFEWRNCDNHQYSLMKLSLRFLSVVWRVFNWTFPNWLLLWYKYKSKKEGNKKKNTKKQNKIVIISYEKYSTSALGSAGWKAQIALGEQLQGNKMASRLAPPMKDENIDKRGGRS